MTAQKPEKGEQWTAAEDFITKSPLFTTVRVDGFEPPSQISFECPGECAKETTWGRFAHPAIVGQSGVALSAIRSVSYTCLLCNRSDLTVIYRNMEQEERTTSSSAVSSGLSKSFPVAPPRMVEVTVAVMKVGQYPPPSISLPKGLEQGLGKDAAALYRRALMSRNSGFGLAAVGYIRRVVEEKTNELIEVAARYEEASGVDAETVAKMRQAVDPAKYTAYEDKLKIAAAVYPDSLRVGSYNPLLMLFKWVSKALHGLSEAQCIEVSDGIRQTFEYLFTNLRAQVEERRAFEKEVKRLSEP